MAIKAGADKTSVFERANLLYEPTASDVKTGWNLMGTGKDLKNFHDLAGVQITWIYTDTWIKDPSIIKKTQGFWAKR